MPKTEEMLVVEHIEGESFQAVVVYPKRGFMLIVRRKIGELLMHLAYWVAGIHVVSKDRK